MNIVNNLLSKKQYTQKSNEWHNIRHNIITASNIASVLDANPYLSKKDLLIKKCTQIENEHNNATHWGTKYEPVALDIYQKLFDQTVHSVGLFIHDNYSWLGASPDGLCETGKLVEIKCVYSRRITDVVPLYYWMQVQIQLEVCDLEDCDFFQCKFIEYANKSEYQKDINELNKGVLEYEGKTYYWRLDKYTIVNIKRDREWFMGVYGELRKFWNDMVYYRRVGIDKLKINNYNEIVIKNRKRKVENEITCLPLKRQKDYVKEDWSKWINSRDTCNYMMKDPILDWLNLYGINNYSQEGDDMFSTYINRKDMEFREAVIKNLYNRFEEKEIVSIADVSEKYSINKYYETVNAMIKGVPIILNGILHNCKNNIYGLSNLILRTDYLDKIIKDGVKMIDENQSKIGYNYCLVNIKYISLALNSRNNIMNTGNVLSYKSELIINNNALESIMGYVPRFMYIVGRKYKQNDISFGTFQNIGVVDRLEHDKGVVPKSNDAIAWLKDLKENGMEWDIRKPHRWELYPNMSNEYDYPWTNVKKKIAEKIGEITMLWNCGTKERDMAHSLGVYNWKKLDSSEIFGFKNQKMEILDSILRVNESKCRNAITFKKGYKKMVKNKLSFYVDFETVNSLDVGFDDVINYDGIKEDSIKCDGMVYMIGLGWAENGGWCFKNFLVDRLNYDCEKKILRDWLDSMEKIKKRLRIRRTDICHWGKAEVIEARKAFERHNIKDTSLDWFDLNDYFKKNCIAVRGSFNYGLKAIANALYNNKKIATKWLDKTLDGMSAMLIAWDCERRCIDGGGDVLADNLEMMDIIKYNEVDCKVMWEIVKLL